MLHLDPARTNRSPFLGPSNPEVAWTFEAGAPIATAPVQLADGTIVIGTLGGKLFGVAPDGRASMTVQLHERVYGSPLLLRDAIYVGVDAKRFVSVSAKGAVRWQLETDGDADTAPTHTPYGAIVFGSGRMVYAVRPDGTVLWRVKAGKKVYSAPAVAPDGTVYVGSQDDRLYAISRDGRIVWSTRLGGDVDCAPAVGDDGTVYVGVDDSAVVALDDKGAVRWRAKVGGHVRGSLTLTRNGAVVAGVYGPAPGVVALEARSGELRWRFAIAGTGATEFGVHGSPVEDAAGRLYFGAQDDHVYALTADGQLLWKLRTGADVDAPVVLASDGRLLAASDDGKLYLVVER
jgi:outer membrane protein assembly factor BamB